ncbi:MAG: hypothetical protein RLZZ50_1451 [Verrucomicrobiota bacterium]
MCELAGLRPGATLCPGVLASRLGSTQAELRAVLADLAEQKRVVITQRSEPADLATLRGPYRVALPRKH